MRYKIHYEPRYELESTEILSYIVNDKSIKGDMDEMITRRSNRYKSVITQFFKSSVELEKHVKKHLQLNIPGYEATGQQFAEFLFKHRRDDDHFFARAIFYYSQLFKEGLERSKEAAILASLDEDFFIAKFGLETLPDINTTDEFFAHLENFQITDTDKLGALRLYHNFELYLNYYTALISQVTQLIIGLRPNIIAEVTPLMDRLNTELESIVQDQFNITLDDKHMFFVYPGIYKVSSAAIMGAGYSEHAPFTIGLHILDFREIFMDTKTAGEDAEAFLKCISDNTKLSILKLLKDGPMYGTQLAEKLNCTGANISHHASALLSLGIVHFEKENNRMYIHLDKEKIIRHIDNLKELF